tara:strand:- start:4339 stop:5829 length:1491 start_codon:yes stop_codon:yes gene_type:complete
MPSTIKLFNKTDVEDIERYAKVSQTSANPYTANVVDFTDYDQVGAYGLIDRLGEGIIPKISNDSLFLLQDAQTYGLTSINSSAQVLDFVADAYTDMINYLQSVRFRAGVFSPNTYEDKDGKTRQTFVQGLEASSGYINPITLHKNHINVIYDHFVQVYLEKNNRHKKINNHKDFLKMFVNYIFSDMYTDIANINLSSHLKRALIPIECSGLVVKLSSNVPGDQATTDEIYYGDPNFSLYASTADKFGFYVDERRPWCLVANLSSKKIDEYARARGSFLVNPASDSGYTTAGGLGHAHEYKIDSSGNGETVSTSAGPYHKHVIKNYCVKTAQQSNPHKHELSRQDVFTKYYVRAQEGEIERLQNLLYRMYNSYIANSPYNIVNTFPKGVLVKKAYTRQPVSEINFNLSLQKKDWIRLYFDLKINEERVFLKRNKYLKILKHAQALLNTLTMQTAVDYINTEINKRALPNGMLSGPNVNKNYNNLPGNNTLKKLSEYF